ncbi:MAG TPA: DUF1003 domain-containing protein [Firmicutes bacterium]|jgi:uncharacterized membrane protein|nr:DUF1003 domain-containing protein [Bacillota bacterium]
MSKHEKMNQAPPDTGSTQIEGFDIEINQIKLDRIDRLVDSYEKSILAHLDNEYLSRTHWSDRLADRIASFGGSWIFITLFILFLLGWMVLNSLSIFSVHFDPYPFILLNLCLSFIAAFQAPVIMMSQNRQAAHDKHESVIDFAINYKAEQEIDDMQNHLHRIEEELSEMKEMLSALNAAANQAGK